MSSLPLLNADDLFPSENESSTRDGSARAPKMEMKKEKRSRAETFKKSAATTSCYSPSASKRVKINPVHKPALTASDLFGTDEDSEQDEDTIESPVTSITSNLATNEILIRCDKCQINVPKNTFHYHTRTNVHKSNCLLKTEYENVEIIATAFRNRIITYRLSSKQKVEYLTPEAFLCDNWSDIIKLIDASLRDHKCIKVSFELFAYFMLPKIDDQQEQQLKSFNTKYEIICENDDLNEIYMNTLTTFQRKFTEFDQCQSGWSLISISHLEINISKYCPMRGGTYIELPSIVKNTKACLNIRNNDNHCFLWSIIASLYPAKRNACRIKSYPHYSDVLNIKGMSFPPTSGDIRLFEKNNPDISINIYGIDKRCIVTGPLYMSSLKKLHHVNLLYIENNDSGHYCLIKNLVGLVRRQITQHNGKVLFCDACLQFFSSESKLCSHSCSKATTILPDKNSKLEFKNYDRQQKINFVIYADFESMLINCHDNEKTKNTQKFKLHKPSCFAYYLCCSHDTNLNKYVTYRGVDCVKIFIENLVADAKYIQSILLKCNPMKPLSIEQQNAFEMATKCHICKGLLLGDKVRDHDHITSEYRGPAHSYCNLMYRSCPFIPIVFHNFSGYDCHLFIEELTKIEGNINVIPKTKEKYISITKTIKTEDPSHPIQLKFIDSFQFLSSSIDELSKILNPNDFINLSKEIGGNLEIELLKRKGIYPYDYIDSWSKYDEICLPPKECFYNSLKLEHISDEEYAHAQAVWNIFGIQTLGDYTDLYLKSDVLLLCDIFENFRQTSLLHFNLDPAYYVSAPSLSWDAMLLCTGVQLELIHDLEQYQMLERGIRGGLAQCSLRHAKANNMYLPDYDDTKPLSYLIYLDCNNLYGHAMRKRLPISDFIFLEQKHIENFDVMSISDDSDYGYILEVDLGYPDHLHNSHSDLPFAPEQFVPPGGKSKKLIASLYDKYHYIIHCVHLKTCIEHGLVLKKIHRILRFRQDNFLQKYIDLNTRLRQASKSEFEKNFFKLLNNAVFGKTIENKHKQVNVKLATKWNDSKNKTNKCIGAEKLIVKPNLKSVTVFTENFVAVQLNPEKIFLDRPIYIGFTVLEYAKEHLYKFHYDYIKSKYNNDAKLCYTDTDSLLYLIKTHDFYADMRKNVSKFDTSNFEENNPYYMPKINAKIPGLFKDELGGCTISEFIGLRAKLYCLKSVKTTIKKAKGVTKAVTKKLELSDYNQTLYNDTTIKRKMNMIKSLKHALYSQQVNKLVLNRNDDKRQILHNQIETLPWGHKDTVF